MAGAKSQTSLGLGSDYSIDSGTSNLGASFPPGSVDSGGLLSGAATIARQIEAVGVALRRSDEHAWRIFSTETTYDVAEIKDALFKSVALAAAFLGGTTALGAAIGAIGGVFVGGAGAVPGAVIGGELGFQAGVTMLNWLGLSFLAIYVVDKLDDVAGHFTRGIALAWDAGAPQPRDEIRLEQAAAEIGRGEAVLVRLILEGIALAIAARGVNAVAGALRSSRLGAGFAAWVEKNAKQLAEHPKYRSASGGAGAASETEGAAAPRQTQSSARSQPRTAQRRAETPQSRQTQQTPAQKPASGAKLNAQQEKSLKRFEKKLPKGKPTVVTDLPNGGKLFEREVPGDVPGSKAIYQKTVDAEGKTVRYGKITYDHKGNFVHDKQKYPPVD